MIDLNNFVDDLVDKYEKDICMFLRPHQKGHLKIVMTNIVTDVLKELNKYLKNRFEI